jgi:adenosylhomocysteine nucleosidase
MRLLIVSALPHEQKFLIRRLRAQRTATHPAPTYTTSRAALEITLIQTGMGISRAEDVLREGIGKVKPRLVLSIGFGGALFEGARVGELIAASRVSLLSSGEAIELSSTEEMANRLQSEMAIRKGTVITLPTWKKKSEVRRLVPPGAPLPVCDMELFVLAHVCREERVPLFAIRAITDTLEREIPIHPEEVSDENGRYRLPRALSSFLRSPRRMPALIALGRNSRIAGRELAAATLHLMDSFATSPPSESYPR